MFEPTEFGKQVNLAVRHHYRGEDAEAERYWERVLQLNANYDIAYIGIGKAKLMKGRTRKPLSILSWAWTAKIIPWRINDIAGRS